jgi:hypothetical protein
VALMMGRISFEAVAAAPIVMVPSPFHFGFALSASAILGFVLTGFVSSIESIGDVEAICEGTAGRPATDAELQGAVAADGVAAASEEAAEPPDVASETADPLDVASEAAGPPDGRSEVEEPPPELDANATTGAALFVGAVVDTTALAKLGAVITGITIWLILLAVV